MFPPCLQRCNNSDSDKVTWPRQGLLGRAAAVHGVTAEGLGTAEGHQCLDSGGGGGGGLLPLFPLCARISQISGLLVVYSSAQILTQSKNSDTESK